MLGETWINHHGHHGKQSTRGIIAPGARDHPILRGIKDGDIWGPTDVYGVRLPLPGDSKPLVLGQVVADMTPEGKPLAGQEERPDDARRLGQDLHGHQRQARPRLHHHDGRRHRPEQRGRAADARQRRLLGRRPGGQDPGQKANVDLVGEYKPTKFGFNGAVKGVRPEAHR